ncbi:MAG: 6,7-dimethyl-8-ribityllumazine synthase [Saprospiraceae bacterium]
MSKHTQFTVSALDPLPSMRNQKVAIISTAWNRHIVEKLETGAIKTLLEHGIEKDDIMLITVPGAFELPFAAKQIRSNNIRLDAIICVGCVIKGDTPHDIYICNAVSQGIMQLNIDNGFPQIPVIFGVLTTNTETQAMDRAGGIAGHKGVEAALSALHMIKFNKNL